jgi:hypothetical protein
VKNYIARMRSWKSEQGLALNAPVEVLATYAPEAVAVQLKKNAEIITSTLKYPSSHEFKSGKPQIQEVVTAVEPVYAKLGPLLKAQSKTVTDWIKSHQSDLIGTLESKGDVTFADLPGAQVSSPNESLLKNGFLTLKREIQIKGKKGSTILGFEDGVYVEIRKG